MFFRINKRFTPAQIIILGFMGIIMLGAALLMLPIATRVPGGASFLEALFTATSATCVTGLVVQDTALYWSPFGQLFAKWPEAEQEYQGCISQTKPRQKLLGTCQLAETKDGHVIASIFGQYHPGADTKYDALEQAPVDLAKQLEEMHVNEIALPYKIGCGIGGGDWSKVQEIIQRTIGHMDVTIYSL